MERVNNTLEFDVQRATYCKLWLHDVNQEISVEVDKKGKKHTSVVISKFLRLDFSFLRLKFNIWKSWLLFLVIACETA